MQLGLYVGTVGTAMWISEDLGETWKRPYSPSGLYMESRVWSLTSRPAWGSHVFAGTDRGIYQWHGPEQKWGLAGRDAGVAAASAMSGSPLQKRSVPVGGRGPRFS